MVITFKCHLILHVLYKDLNLSFFFLFVCFLECTHDFLDTFEAQRSSSRTTDKQSNNFLLPKRCHAELLRERLRVHSPAPCVNTRIRLKQQILALIWPHKPVGHGMIPTLSFYLTRNTTCIIFYISFISPLMWSWWWKIEDPFEEIL